MSLFTKSLVLKHPPNDDDLFFDAYQLIASFSEIPENGFVYDGLSTPGSGVRIHQWRNSDHANMIIQLVLDEVAKIRYLSIGAHDATETALREKLFKLVAQRFSSYSVAELRAAVRSDLENKAAWLSLALTLDGEFDSEVYESLSTELKSSNRASRRNAGEIAVLLQWPELKQPLAAAIATESDRSIKAVLELALREAGIDS